MDNETNVSQSDEHTGAVVVIICHADELLKARQLFNVHLQYQHSMCAIDGDQFALWHFTSETDAMRVYSRLRGENTRVSVQNWIPDEWLNKVTT